MGTFGGAQPIVTDGLVFAVDAANKDSYSGGTLWKDLSGNGNDGTLTNGPTFDSGNGGSIVFDGANDYVNTSIKSENFFTSDSPITVSVWSKIDSKNRFAFIGTGEWKVEGFSIFISSTSELVFAVNDGRLNTSFGVKISIDEYNINEWMYITGVFSSGELFIYKNGILYDNKSGSWSTGNYNMRVGWTTQSGYTPIDGSISQSKIYNRALSASEISQNYNALKGRFGL